MYLSFSPLYILIIPQPYFFSFLAVLVSSNFPHLTFSCVRLLPFYDLLILQMYNILLQMYNMTVRAFDLGTPSLYSDVNVRVFILDQNDHAPKVSFSLSVRDMRHLFTVIFSPVPNAQVLGGHPRGYPWRHPCFASNYKFLIFHLQCFWKYIQHRQLSASLS